ncbi:MAG TPA: hypothetical protein VMK13_14575 [Streptosporangiaceae bacterium]|nr:hypothetical protein [Streptosporangiaceae bacterium]
MDRVGASAKQPQQVGGGHAVKVSDADDQTRELAVAGEFVRAPTC